MWYHITSGTQNFFRYVASRGRRAPSVNLGPPIISETTGARKLKLKTQPDVVKYPLWVQKLLYYIGYNMRASAILIFNKSISPRQTTANNCKTAFSLLVVESASDD